MPFKARIGGQINLFHMEMKSTSLCHEDASKQNEISCVIGHQIFVDALVCLRIDRVMQFHYFAIACCSCQTLLPSPFLLVSR